MHSTYIFTPNGIIFCDDRHVLAGLLQECSCILALKSYVVLVQFCVEVQIQMLLRSPISSQVISVRLFGTSHLPRI